MSTKPTTLEEALASIAKLEKALDSERTAHAETKRTHGEFRAAFTTPLGLPPESPVDAILSAMGDTEKLIGERTASVAKERDEARAKAADVESRWAGEKVDRALSDALARSGMIEANREDALGIARSLFTVDGKGEVRTKAGAAGVIPGATPDQWILGQLRALRSHWWARSQGGGAVGGARSTASVGDTSCFRPGPTWNLTAQVAFERRHGSRAAEAAAREYGATPFGVGGGR